MKRIEVNCATGTSIEIDQLAYTDVNGLPILIDVGAPSDGLTPITFEQYAMLRAPPPPTKEQQIEAMLAVSGKDRLLIQTVITVVEAQAQVLAAQYGVSVEVALATLYTRNKSYRVCKDLEAAIRAVETAP